MATCYALALTAILSITNPPTQEAAELASFSICEASAQTGVHPAWLVSYLAVENKNFHAYGTGSDTGLFQINMKWNGHRLKNPLDYEEQSNAAAAVIQENVERFGMNWKGVAAYNSWNNAIKENATAQDYFGRWRREIVKISYLWENHG